MAIATNNSRVYASLQLRAKEASTYLVIGKTSAWTNEDAPPQADPNTTTLQEVVGYKKVTKMSLCRPFVEGETTTLPTVTYGAKKYVLVPDAQAYTQKAMMVYIEAEIVGEELPLGTYRQVGIHTDVTPKSGVTKKALLPTEVSSTGVLQFFENRKQQNRTADVTVREKFIVNMQNGKTLT